MNPGNDLEGLAAYSGVKGLQRPSKVGYVVEGILGDGFCHCLGLHPIAPEYNDSSVMVFHRQPPILLRLAHVIKWQIPSVGDRVSARFLRTTGVNPHCGLVLLPNILHPFSFNLRESYKGTPHRNAQLVSPTVALPCWEHVEEILDAEGRPPVGSRFQRF
jgi:hypothetical protein